jgi:hypothetical protein
MGKEWSCSYTLPLFNRAPARSSCAAVARTRRPRSESSAQEAVVASILRAEMASRQMLAVRPTVSDELDTKLWTAALIGLALASELAHEPGSKPIPETLRAMERRRLEAAQQLGPNSFALCALQQAGVFQGVGNDDDDDDVGHGSYHDGGHSDDGSGMRERADPEAADARLARKGKKKTLKARPKKVASRAQASSAAIATAAITGIGQHADILRDV